MNPSHPFSAQECKEMRSLHQRGRKIENYNFTSSYCLCLRGSGSFSLFTGLFMCRPGSLHMGTLVPERWLNGFLEMKGVSSLDVFTKLKFFFFVQTLLCLVINHILCIVWKRICVAIMYEVSYFNYILSKKTIYIPQQVVNPQN